MHTKLAPVATFLISLFVSLTPVSVLAQESALPNLPPGVETTLVSAVEITDVSVTENKGVYTGTYNVVGNDMGQQNDINIGIIVYDSKSNFVDVVKLENGISIRQGEKKSYTFSYTLPSYVSGAVRVFLRADTEGGLPLGVNVLDEKTVTASTKHSVSCKPTVAGQEVSFSCTATRSGTATLSFSKSSALSTVVNSDRASLSANTPATLKATLTPGRYYARISLLDTKEALVFPISVAGAFGTIVNVAVEGVDANSIKVIVPTNFSKGVGPLSASATLSGPDGSSCGTGKSDPIGATAPLAMMTISTACHSGNITVTLVDAGGRVFDTYTGTYNVDTVEPAATTPSSTSATQIISLGTMNTWWVGLIVLAVLGIGAYVVMVVLKKRREESEMGSGVPFMRDSDTPSDRTL